MLERKQVGRRSKRPLLSEFAMMYDNQTAREVAEHYGVSVSTVKRWASEYRKELENAKINE